MPTTTVRLSAELKERLGVVAQQAGVSSHALILEAIADRIDAEERRNALISVAEARYDNLLKTGEAIPWSEMRRYLRHRADGEVATRPAPRKLLR